MGLGSKLAFVPDLHYHLRGEWYIETAADAIRRVDPDVLVIAGDLVDEGTRDFEGLKGILGEISCNENILYWVITSTGAATRGGR